MNSGSAHRDPVWFIGRGVAVQTGKPAPRQANGPRPGFMLKPVQGAVFAEFAAATSSFWPTF
jgi:hypothetical protein